MPNEKQCWFCNHFLADSIADSVSGSCHKNAPTGLDSNTRPADNYTDSRLWAPIYDATVEWCGDYKPTINPVDAPTP